MHKLTIAPSAGKTVEAIPQGDCFFYKERHYIRAQETGNQRGFYHAFCAENNETSIFAGTCPVYECKNVVIIITE